MPIHRVSQHEIETAVAELRAGRLVAFPTETVYGLGANAGDPSAVRRIFAAKGRPSTHPLIVHLDDPKYLGRWARSVPPAAEQLGKAFWPGPLTLVFERAPAVHDVVTGGQDTIAVRVPSHPVARQLLTAFGGGIAAPSANRYGHISPTRAEHVRDEFGDTIEVILDGGDCKIGLESTIVSCVSDPPLLLRPGSITLSQLRGVVPEIIEAEQGTAPRVPGSDARHYAPETPLHVVPEKRLEQVAAEYAQKRERVAVLAMRPPGRTNRHMTWINAGSRPEAYGHALYANLRTLDRVGAQAILIQELPGDERWVAIRDRIRRAATAEKLVTSDPDIAAMRALFDEDDLP
ncbi:MAG TPA: L-threonylcarbamoyladenylate synthase [Steroidobacteraceae bacterium]|nr:L-threonylcarbamoyladenylate synthase [Steroidobacteraceae bacterium]